MVAGGAGRVDGDFPRPGRGPARGQRGGVPRGVPVAGQGWGTVGEADRGVVDVDDGGVGDGDVAAGRGDPGHGGERGEGGGQGRDVAGEGEVFDLRGEGETGVDRCG